MVKLNTTGDASRWSVLKRFWTPLGCGYDFVSIVLKKPLDNGNFFDYSRTNKR